MRNSLAALCLSLLATGCSVGPKSIPGDQFDYGVAIASAGPEQILKNSVGLRQVERAAVHSERLEDLLLHVVGNRPAGTGRRTHPPP